MEKTDEKDTKPNIATQDKLALRDYTNQAIASLKNQELDAMKSSILNTLKSWLGGDKK
ncbi:MAG: hypothetical protein LBD67_10695 [Candidatus Accumulibacter sp.]|jgi:hypothetical protein|nr:hypothetical protein [Accumulibacter sp.]